MRKKSIFKEIEKWNEERNLIKTPKDFDVYNDMSFIIEELYEMVTPLKSKEARVKALALMEVIKRDDYKPTEEQIIDALGDVIVFATGSIRKQGYDTDIVMEEVLKEINSRTGNLIDGKFVKDKSKEAQEKWYKADFSKAKIED